MASLSELAAAVEEGERIRGRYFSRDQHKRARAIMRNHHAVEQNAPPIMGDDVSKSRETGDDGNGE